MITIIKTLNLNRQTTAILENAYNIGYEKEVNAIWQASFSLPLNDPKLDKVELLKYVEITDGGEYIGLFRIIPKLTIKNDSTQEAQFQCEHVLATLLDKSLFKYHQLSNYTTYYVLDYLINQQIHKHWRMGTIDFTRYFHYSWENENLLSSIFSVPRPFNEAYIWEYNTQSYPWTLSLIRPDDTPVCRIKEGYNLIGLEIEEDPQSQYNRIYPLGAGEGVNQLTISSINNGLPYLEDRQPGEEIREMVWVDQRFTDVESLKASAQAMLDKWKVPQVTWKVSAADVSRITGLSIDKFKVGKVVRLQLNDYPDVDLRIMKETKKDIAGDPGDVQLEIGNVREDLSTTNSDLERRQQINELYSQGATNIFNFTYQDNCDDEIPAIIPFYIDDDVVNINTVELTYRTKKFRAYSQATHGGGSIVTSTKDGGSIIQSTEDGGGIVKATGGGGAIVKSTSAGGATVQSTSSGGSTVQSTTSGGGTTATSSSGGGTSTSTQSGGGSNQTSSQNSSYPIVAFDSGLDQDGDPAPAGRHFHRVTVPTTLLNHTHSVSIPAHSHSFSTPNHTHSVSIPNHSHDVSIPNHRHDVTIPDHTHEIELPNHTHEIDLPDHTHEIKVPDHTHEIELPDHIHDVKHEIIELDTMPDTVAIKVDGNIVPITSTSGDRIDLVDYMNKDNSGKITRGRHEVEILPAGLARIEADLILRVFIQSQLGGNF
ncbi:phage tail protein [Gracilibacillus alcaliphilus]|uniref:phage tail protein n=1 Tax=Gracilibacillus alcaliphilus TaxID=1401441 RepID=UPI00308439A5